MKDTMTFDQQLGESVHMLALELRAGYPLKMVFDKLADTLPQPISALYRTLSEAADTEQNVIEALKAFHEKNPSTHIFNVLNAFQHHHDEGGSLPDRLEPVAQAIISAVGIDAEVREADYILERSIRLA